MKTDFKMIIIFLLVGIIGLLAGYILGKDSSNTSSTGVALNPEFIKEYKESVARTIRENGKELRVCYLEHLKVNPKIEEGRIDLILKIEEDGNLESLEITRNELKNENFNSCVKEKIQRIRFMPPPPGVNRYVPHSLAFKSDETAAREAQERKKKLFPKVLPSR